MGMGEELDEEVARDEGLAALRKRLSRNKDDYSDHKDETTARNALQRRIDVVEDGKFARSLDSEVKEQLLEARSQNKQHSFGKPMYRWIYPNEKGRTVFCAVIQEKNLGQWKFCTRLFAVIPEERHAAIQIIYFYREFTHEWKTNPTMSIHLGIYRQLHNSDAPPTAFYELGTSTVKGAEGLPIISFIGRVGDNPDKLELPLDLFFETDRKRDIFLKKLVDCFPDIPWGGERQKVVLTRRDGTIKRNDYVRQNYQPKPQKLFWR